MHLASSAPVQGRPVSASNGSVIGRRSRFCLSDCTGGTAGGPATSTHRGVTFGGRPRRLGNDGKSSGTVIGTGRGPEEWSDDMSNQVVQPTCSQGDYYDEVRWPWPPGQPRATVLTSNSPTWPLGQLKSMRMCLDICQLLVVHFRELGEYAVGNLDAAFHSCGMASI